MKLWRGRDVLWVREPFNFDGSNEISDAIDFGGGGISFLL